MEPKSSFSVEYKRWSQHWILLQSSSSLKADSTFDAALIFACNPTKEQNVFRFFKIILENGRGCNSSLIQILKIPAFFAAARLLKFLNVTITADKILCHLIYLSWIREYWKDLLRIPLDSKMHYSTNRTSVLLCPIKIDSLQLCRKLREKKGGQIYGPT